MKSHAIYAFTALRYLIAGFKLEKNYSEQVEKDRVKALKKESLKKLRGLNRAAWSELDEIREELEQQIEW